MTKQTLSRRAAAINRSLHPAEAAALLAAYEAMPMSRFYIITDERTGKPRNINHADAVEILAARKLLRLRQFGLVPDGAEPSAELAVATFTAPDIEAACEAASNYLVKQLGPVAYQADAFKPYTTSYVFRLKPAPLRLLELSA